MSRDASALQLPSCNIWKRAFKVVVADVEEPVKLLHCNNKLISPDSWQPRRLTTVGLLGTAQLGARL